MSMFNNKGVRYNVNGEYFMSLTEVSGYVGCSVNRINKELGNTSSCDINEYHIIRETNNYRLAKSNRYKYVNLVEQMEIDGNALLWFCILMLLGLPILLFCLFAY